MLRALHIDAAVGCKLKQVPDALVSNDEDDHGWRAAARLVTERGGQLIFGWVFFECEQAVKAESRVVWLDVAQNVMWNVCGELGNFFPDENAMNAFRSLGVAPPDWFLWK